MMRVDDSTGRGAGRDEEGFKAGSASVVHIVDFCIVCAAVHYGSRP
jgi:hypothetical protein